MVAVGKERRGGEEGGVVGEVRLAKP